jgi:BRCT domain type II-containing protein
MESFTKSDSGAGVFSIWICDSVQIVGCVKKGERVCLKELVFVLVEEMVKLTRVGYRTFVRLT